MNNRLRIQKKAFSQSNATPPSNLFQSRSLSAAEVASPTPQETPDLQQQQEQAMGKGFNVLEIPNLVAANSPPPEPSQGLGLQAKLTIGEPGDRYEQEADTLTSQLVQRINVPQRQMVQRDEMIHQDELQVQPQINFLQREEMPEAQEELRMMPQLGIFPQEEIFQEDGSERQHDSVSETGLPQNVQTKMETAFVTNFSDVRVHPNSSSANALGVEAYTQGSDIHFASGNYQPHTTSGQKLIGHELAHIIQQRQGRVNTTAQARGYAINDDDTLEHEAETMGNRAARGEPVVMTGANAAAHTPERTAPIQASGIELLKSKDPEPSNTDALKDWPTLKASAASPSAADVHQILLTYEKLSDGWKSGMGEVLQALSNKYSDNETVPDSEIDYGGIMSAEIAVEEESSSLAIASSSESTYNKKKHSNKRKPTDEPEEATKSSNKYRKPSTLSRGQWMKADLLTPKGPAGSDATTGAYVGYGGAVEGHLLNAHLHGPAEYKNLAPFSSNLNKKHSALVEEPLKKMIYNQGKYFRYQVSVNPGSRDEGFYPDSITCDVIEVDAAKQTVANGYEHHVTINQKGNPTELGTKNIGTAPAKSIVMNFNANASASSESKALTALWNKLKFPWTRSYGEVMREVLETAYIAIRNYEQMNGAIGMNEALALPQTKVTFTTGQVTNPDNESETIGVCMVADPLTMRPPASGEFGYEPEEAWGQGAVKGHLLNHHLHGPAKPKNLAPMSNSLNQTFERQVESLLKQMVLKEGKVVRFEVNMTDSVEMFGFDDAPEKLEYQIQEYKPKEGADDLEDIANWQLDTAIATGSLYNSVDGALASDEYVDNSEDYGNASEEYDE